MLRKILTKSSKIFYTSLLMLAIGASSLDILDREWIEFTDVEQQETGEEESKESTEGDEVESEDFFLSNALTILGKEQKHFIPLRSSFNSTNWATSHDPPPEFL